MQPQDFSEHRAGHLRKHERGYWAFVPNSLPPELPLTWELAGELSAADRGVSELAGIGRTLPNPYLLIRPFMHREAVLSSRIEGTQASLSDLYFFEAASVPPSPQSDVREVRNYVTAMEYGLKRLKDLPVTRLSAHKRKYPRELEYFSFYIISSKNHEREIETAILRAAGPQMILNTRKVRSGIHPGNVRDYEPGTEFYERQSTRGKRKKN